MSSDYANDSGELELAFDMRPGYPTTVYKDAYRVFAVRGINPAERRLEFETRFDLNYENGDIIDHLAFHEFEFTR